MKKIRVKHGIILALLTFIALGDSLAWGVITLSWLPGISCFACGHFIGKESNQE